MRIKNNFKTENPIKSEKLSNKDFYQGEELTCNFFLKVIVIRGGKKMAEY